MDSNPATAQAPVGLTIGELATRTGLAPATVRAWESRHGFPRAERTGTGHRRYPESEVGLVQQVLRRKAAGVRLESAITEALRSGTTATGSVFAELRRRHPHLSLQPLRKSTLLALTWAMEDEYCARAQQPLLFGAFQHGRFFDRAERRWTELARTARSTVVLADFAGSDRALDRITRVQLPDDAPMRREWTLVCDAPDHPAVLAAWELPGQVGVRDRDRVFESVWSLEPRVVREATRTCRDVVEQLVPGSSDALGGLDDVVPEASDDLRSATSMFSRMLGYVDKVR